MSEKLNYKARCHCGRVHFSFRAEEITTGKRCNCSICIRKGAVVSSVYFPAEDFEHHRNKADFIAYQWNDGVVDHLFCKTCGIYPYHGDADVFALDIGLIDGASMPVTEPPQQPF